MSSNNPYALNEGALENPQEVLQCLFRCWGKINQSVWCTPHVMTGCLKDLLVHSQWHKHAAAFLSSSFVCVLCCTLRSPWPISKAWKMKLYFSLMCVCSLECVCSRAQCIGSCLWCLACIKSVKDAKWEPCFVFEENLVGVGKSLLFCFQIHTAAVYLNRSSPGATLWFQVHVHTISITWNSFPRIDITISPVHALSCTPYSNPLCSA